MEAICPFCTFQPQVSTPLVLYEVIPDLFKGELYEEPEETELNDGNPGCFPLPSVSPFPAADGYDTAFPNPLQPTCQELYMNLESEPHDPNE